MRYKIDLTNALDISKYKLTMGNRVIFKSPNIPITIKDGGKDTEYEIENIKNLDLENIHQQIISSFIISTDNDFKTRYMTEHSLDKSLVNGDLVLIGDKDKFNSLMSRIKEYEKADSELLKLLNVLYSYVSTKEINIDITDIMLKVEDGKLKIIFSKNDRFNNEENIEYVIGDTKVTINWKNKDSNKIEKVNDDVSIYIAKVKFNKLETEINDLFKFDTPLVFDKPDLSQIAREISEFKALINSFLTVGVGRNGFENATAFRYSFDNGVKVNIDEDIDIFIGRQFGIITLSFKKTKASRTVSIRDDSMWKSINRPDIEEPLKAIHELANELYMANNVYKNGNFALLLKSLSVELIYDLADDADLKIVVPLLTFERINEHSYKFIFTYNEDYKMELVYDGTILATLYKNGNIVDAKYVTTTILSNLSEISFSKKPEEVLTDKIKKFERFRDNLNILHKYTE